MTPALVSDYNTRKMRRRERKSDITKRKLHDPTAGRIGRAPRQNRGQRVSCLIFANHFISCRHYNYLLSFLRGSYFARCRSCGGPSACLGGGQRASGSYRALLCVFVCVLLKLYEGTWNVRIKEASSSRNMWATSRVWSCVYVSEGQPSSHMPSLVIQEQVFYANKPDTLPAYSTGRLSIWGPYA